MIDNEEAQDSPELEEAPAPAVKASTPKPKEKTSTATPTAIPAGHTVSLGALTYKAKARNSASVRAVQTRLLELGHLGAGSDLPGWLAEGTLEALTEFHSVSKLKGDVLSRETVEALFKGLSVKVID